MCFIDFGCLVRRGGCLYGGLPLRWKQRRRYREGEPGASWGTEGGGGGGPTENDWIFGGSMNILAISMCF